MNKVLSLLLAVAMLLSFAACAKTDDGNVSTDTPSNSTQSNASEDTMSTTSAPDTRYRATREKKPDGFKYKRINKIYDRI